MKIELKNWEGGTIPQCADNAAERTTQHDRRSKWSLLKWGNRRVKNIRFSEFCSSLENISQLSRPVCTIISPIKSWRTRYKKDFVGWKRCHFPGVWGGMQDCKCTNHLTRNSTNVLYLSLSTLYTHAQNNTSRIVFTRFTEEEEEVKQ